MIDNDLRIRRLLQEARDPETAVILLDVVLGYGAHPDPAGELGPAIRQARTLAREAGCDLPVVASVTGYRRLIRKAWIKPSPALKKPVSIVCDSNAAAARLTGMIVSA